ncbi:hypothetical protein [Oligoflexus tunisiensis]|uniref:hypothetical protein n=1 Tax=Oligoflexus tunisiensis TaxID=708132 RepID=UPI00114C99BA|nr:hypothetical protein [Oligoflexus tunisiensis]
MTNSALVPPAQQSSGEPGELVDIKVIPQELFVQGQRSIINVIRSGKTEGLTVGQVADMVNISERNVWKHIYRHAITTAPLGQHSLRGLKDAGVVLIHAKRAAFVPKSSVQQLLKLINTPESWAIYYQLWNNSARLTELELQLANAEVSRDEAVQRAVQLEVEMSELRARLEAATHALSLGENRKKPRFEIKFHRHETTDIFKNPVVTIERTKKSINEMNPHERKHFRMQHGTRSLAGTAKMLLDESTASDVTNETLRHSAVIMQAGVLAYQNTLMPDEGSLFALNKSNPMTFLNDMFHVERVFNEAN